MIITKLWIKFIPVISQSRTWRLTGVTMLFSLKLTIFTCTVPSTLFFLRMLQIKASALKKQLFHHPVWNAIPATAVSSNSCWCLQMLCRGLGEPLLPITSPPAPLPLSPSHANSQFVRPYFAETVGVYHTIPTTTTKSTMKEKHLGLSWTEKPIHELATPKTWENLEHQIFCLNNWPLQKHKCEFKHLAIIERFT